MKKKTIVFSLENFDPFGGGAESYTIALAKTLIERGWEVHFVGETWRQEPADAIFHPISIWHWVPAGIQMLWFSFCHRSIAKKLGADVVIGFGNTIWMNVYQSHGGVHWVSTFKKMYSIPNRFFRILKRISVLFSFKQWVRNWIEKAPLRLHPMPEIIAISPMVKEDLARCYKISKEKIHVVVNGIDTNMFRPEIRGEYREAFRTLYNIPDTHAVFLFASFDLRKKGFYILLEAAHELKKKGYTNFTVAVAGGMPDRYARNRIKKYDLGSTILFLGKVAPMDLAYGGSDVFVIPTYYDSCSLVVQEAMASGMPVITTTAAGVAQTITSGTDGIVIAYPPTKEALGNAIEDLLDPMRRQEMGKVAFQKSAQYDARKNHEEMIRIFEEVANRQERNK